MVHSTINRERENAGSVSVVYHKIDITELDNTGTENYDPDAEVGISGADEYGVDVVGLEDPSLAVQWDHPNGALNLRNLSDGAQVADNTDVGEVILRVFGK
jgi:hypothetical protein